MYRSLVPLKDALLALSLANLCFIKVWFELLRRDFDSYYITETPPTAGNLYGAVLNVILAAGIIFAVLSLCRRYTRGSFDAPGKITLLLLVAIFLNGLRMQYWYLFLDKLGKGGSMVLLGVLAFGLAVALIGYRRTYPAGRTLVFLLSPFVLFAFGQAVSIAHDRTISEGLKDKVRDTGASRNFPSRRVVVLLYDEMDYRITFVDRPARAHLPELDRLRGESLFFSDAYPPAGGTLLSIPALITGKTVVNAKVSRINDILLTFDDGTTSLWSQRTNMFTEAKAVGVDSALVGCYHPYCRVMGEALSSCASYPSTDTGLLECMLRQWRRLTPFYLRQQHAERYRFVQHEAKRAVADPHYGLVFVHLPVPHGPAIYDGVHDRFTLLGSTVSDNIDNLRLADRSLGELRKAMEDSGVWPYTTVILTADHWWRTSRSYDGKEDHRVPLLIRMAGHKEHRDINEPIRTVFLSAVVRCLLGANKRDKECETLLSSIRLGVGSSAFGSGNRVGVW